MAPLGRALVRRREQEAAAAAAAEEEEEAGEDSWASFSWTRRTPTTPSY
jgi:hypothetical protein